MAIIDPSKNLKVLEDRLAIEDDPIRRRNLRNIIHHAKSELVGDFDATLAFMSEQAQHRSYGTDDPAQNPKGKAEIRAFYANMLALNLLRLQIDCDRLIVDRACVLVEGVLKMAYPGAILQHMGIEVDDIAADYLYEARVATLWPFDEDGLSLGEHSYGAGNGFAGIAQRKLAPGDIAPTPAFAPPYIEEPLEADAAYGRR